MSIATPARKSQTISQEIGESQKLLFKIYSNDYLVSPRTAPQVAETKNKISIEGN